MLGTILQAMAKVQKSEKKAIEASVVQLSLFDFHNSNSKPSNPIRKVSPLEENPMGEKKPSAKRQQKKNRFKEWKKTVEAGLCIYPEKMELLKNSQERKALDYQLEEVKEHYVHQLEISLNILGDYDKARAIGRIANKGMDENKFAVMQKIANGLLIEARGSKSADDLMNAADVVMLVSLLSQVCKIQTMLSRGEVVPPVHEYFVKLEQKRKQGSRFASILLSDKQLYEAFAKYAKKAKEIAQGQD
ncbi:MAG: hypothetical protein QW275_01180 [Candidatus Anstonellaceae archaeon]